MLKDAEPVDAACHSGPERCTRAPLAVLGERPLRRLAEVRVPTQEAIDARQLRVRRLEGVAVTAHEHPCQGAVLLLDVRLA